MLILKDRPIELPNQISPIRVNRADYEMARPSPAALTSVLVIFAFQVCAKPCISCYFSIPAPRNALSEMVTAMDIFVLKHTRCR